MNDWLHHISSSKARHGVILVATLLFPTLVLGTEIDLGRKRIVVIDVGHTRVSPGAISVSGIPEYEFNLRIARKVEAALQETGKIEPVLIVSDKSRTLLDRTRVAAARNAELFVSIHHDSAQDKYVEELAEERTESKFDERFAGYSVFVSHKNPEFEESLKLARRVGAAMTAAGFKFARHHAEAIRGENRPIIDEGAGVYAFDDLVVLKSAAMPAVLVECGVIVNPAEEKSLLTPERQAKITTAIVRGITGYLAQSPVPSSAPPKLPGETSSPTPRKYPKPGTQPERTIKPDAERRLSLRSSFCEIRI
jgi:N-acetylmuramoyl-L-alanine amidase